MTTHPITLADIQAAHERIREHIVCTPTVFSPAISNELDATVSFKCENLQHVYAFKARGACNAVMLLNHEQAAAGVVAHSSGNHAAAIARAAKTRGVTAHIVMPHNSPEVKIHAVRGLGVEPTFCEPTTEARQQAAAEIVERTGATLIHPFDNTSVIAGQGTVALEILQQSPEVDTLVIPIGGGGLTAGCLIAAKSLRPDIRVIAAEPEWADDAYRSWKAGTIQPPVRYDSIGDGLRTCIGNITFPIINDLVDEIMIAGEDSIATATRTLFHKGRLVSEPSGAVPLAVMSEHRDAFRGRNVVGVISGGNVDLGQFSMSAV